MSLFLYNRGADRCRHYMVEMQNNGKYVILGEDRAHSSLIDLVQFHSQVGIKPFMELLTVPCGQVGVRHSWKGFHFSFALLCGIMMECVCLQMCDREPDYEELKALTSSSSSSSESSAVVNAEDMDPCSNKVHVQMQRLFLPPGGNSNVESHKPPVLKRISDRRRRIEAAQMEHKDDNPNLESRPFPRLYPSIRLAMREIQQIQQVQTHKTYRRYIGLHTLYSSQYFSGWLYICVFVQFVYT